jgi:hypothetical protein
VSTQETLLDVWRQQKATGRNFYRLREGVTQEHEYKGHHWGHPSNYALVRFRCEPADELTFLSEAPWPAHLSSTYCTDLERAVGVAILDALMGEFYPYRGCTLTLVGVGWDDVMSSEAAFYRATKGAMADLRSVGKWDAVTVGHGRRW